MSQLTGLRVAVLATDGFEEPEKVGVSSSFSGCFRGTEEQQKLNWHRFFP
jgi:hypothetical protein